MAKRKLKVLSDYILIEPEKAETKTLSGIIIPDRALEQPSKGKVIAVGSGDDDLEIEVTVGETILYRKGSGTPVSYDEKKYLVMRQSDILLVV